MNGDSNGPGATFQNGYMFHPFEISICGYSNSGKTALIMGLIENLSSQFDIGYIKYGVHKFEIDKEKNILYPWIDNSASKRERDEAFTKMKNLPADKYNECRG